MVLGNYQLNDTSTMDKVVLMDAEELKGEVVANR
jgi:hypothetical protein